MSFLKEFREFALKGNMVDMAVGIIIGASFNRVVNSLVNDIIMPPLGFLIGGINFNSLSIKLGLNGGKPIEIRYGAFISQMIDFLIIALAIFLVIKGMNTLRREKKVESKERECPECLMQIPKKANKCYHCGSATKRL